ncbi:MAG: hypothetical protein ACLQCU_11240 [Acidimicrobiales bacterium]
MFAVESLLSRKLGLGDDLERGTVTFEARIGQLTEGAADYGYAIEPIAMANVLVRVVRGSALLPKCTASYSSIRWVEPEALADAFEMKRAGLVIPDADPIDVCIHGLCVSTTTDLVRRGSVRDAAQAGAS